MPEWPLGALDAVTLRQFVRLDAISPHVLRFGYVKGIIDEQHVVDLQLRRFQHGLASGVSEEDLALLLSDDLSRVPILLESATASPPAIDPARVWAYVGTKLIRTRWEANPEAIYELAGLIESLGMPESYRGLVYYEPRAKGSVKAGSPARLLRAIDERLQMDGETLGLG